MNNLSLTYFVDFVLKAGTPKVTVVRDFKGREEYDPQTDFYKALREQVVETFRAGKKLADLEPWSRTVHEKKQAAYGAAVQGIKQFIGRKTCVWFEPPKTNFDLQGLTINVNPELGLKLNGVPHVIKIYLKDDPPLVKNRAQLILHLLQKALPKTKGTPPTFAVLDARKAKLHTSAAAPAGIDALLAGEALAFRTMFDKM